MQRIAGRIVVLVLGLSLAAECQGQDKPPTPAEQYQALLKEYQVASSGGALSDEERMKFVGRVYRLRSKLALAFLELAEKNPEDPIAVDALIQAVWQVNTTPWPAELVGADDARSRSLVLLERDHIRSDKLGPVCQRMSFGFCEEYETFLRAVVEMNPDKEVQALRSTRPGQRAAGTSQRVRRPVRQRVPRSIAAAGQCQGR
jgi:hypothetical protein